MTSKRKRSRIRFDEARYDPQLFNRCRRKRRYNSEREAAAKAAQSGAERPALVTEGLGPYRCRDCRGWHIGRARKRKAAR